MIVGVLAAGALMGLVKGLARPVRMFRASLDLLAGEKRQEVKRPVKLELFLSLEQFDRLVGQPEVELALIQCAALKRAGQIPTCQECGGQLR
jgi:hypothetical protein